MTKKAACWPEMRDDWRTSLHTFERPITCSVPRSSETGGTPAASLPPPSSLNRPHTASAASPPEPAASEPARLEGGSAIVAVSGSGGVGRVAVIGLSRRLPPPALPRPPPPLTYGGEALPTYWDEAPLFADIPADMSDEEKALAASTPSTPPPGLVLPEVNEVATHFVTKSNTGNKVVVWSLEYCEFCWTLSMLFNTLKVDYVKIDIDSFQYAKDNLGNQYRAALQAQTKCMTFPQFFVDGTFHGGAVDACLKWKKGELQTIFARAKVAHGPYDGDPFEFLPKWMSQNPLRSK